MSIATASIFALHRRSRFQNGFSASPALAVADEDDRPALEVQDDRQVAVSLGDGDLVDGDLPQVLELGLGVAAAEVALLDVLDDVPADAQVAGHVEDGHAPRQFQGVALEGLGVGPPRVGEGDLDLADHATGLAGDAWDREDDGGGAAADGQRSEPPLDLTSGPDVARAAGFAPEGLGFLADGEDHLAALIRRCGRTRSLGCRRRDTTGWWTC